MKSNVCIIDEILLKVYKNKNNIIISINRKMPIRILTSNNRIIIKENFAALLVSAKHRQSISLNPRGIALQYNCICLYTLHLSFKGPFTSYNLSRIKCI